MLLPPPKPRPRAESIVPMINVVFLLLIFFLMTAHIAPPDPFEVVLPTAAPEEKARGPVTLYFSAEGVAGFQDKRGNDAIAAVQQAISEAGETGLLLRADAGVEATKLATLIRQLKEAGMTEITLLTAAQ